jgi:uncharacterized protein YndB with AHSA1/START domain
MEVTRSITISRPRDEVFAYVADARNDPQWCPKVISTELADSDGRYAVLHKPIPGRPAREMTMTCQSQEPPARIEWYEDDGSDSFQVTYILEDLGGSTRFTQRSVASLSTPRVFAPIMRHGIGRDIDKQLKSLKATLEARPQSS